MQTFLTKCPFCDVAEPTIARVHGEIIAECCNNLLLFIEEQDPEGETGLMTACFDREAALIDWKGCVEFASQNLVRAAAKRGRFITSGYLWEGEKYEAYPDLKKD